MAFKRINAMDIYEIIRRWHDGQSKSYIAQTLIYDRKTVNKYITIAKHNGISKEKILPEKDYFLKLFKDCGQIKNHKQPAQSLLLPYKEEIIQMVKDKKNLLKPKMAYEVICQKYQLQVSYSSFKRFYKKNCQSEIKLQTTCCIETKPGDFLQIDYAKMGVLFDPHSNKNRNVYAFVATLSYSRHKFVEFVFKQDQKSFIASHIKAFEFFGGVPHIIVLDNLKTGVLKPDLYDPKLNRNYQEMAEHYNCFLDTCRVAHPKDKAKVERDIQTIRDKYRKFKALNPNILLSEADQQIRDWLLNTYGQKAHGTTGKAPMQLFCSQEQPCLLPLPVKQFELAEWKTAKVHPDCYIQYKKKFFSVPNQYIGKKVWVKATEKIIYIYFNQQLIKQHLITEDTRHTDFNDFPKNVQIIQDGNYRKHLLKKARSVGYYFHQIIHHLLKMHAFINLRKAIAIVNLIDKYPNRLLEHAAVYIYQHKSKITPQNFKRLLNDLQSDKNRIQKSPDIGSQSEVFIRPIEYFINHQKKGECYDPSE